MEKHKFEYDAESGLIFVDDDYLDYEDARATLAGMKDLAAVGWFDDDENGQEILEENIDGLEGAVYEFEEARERNWLLG